MIFPTIKKGIQCRECECFGHIQSECANTRKKKNKALKSTWSDEEFEGSQEEDELVSNQVGFSGSFITYDRVFMQGRVVATDSVFLSVKTIFVPLKNKSATKNECGSEFDSGDESKKDYESLHEAYEKMYR